ncbi:MAG: methyltransferase domain-containing protein [Pseudomonadota bacterium]
MTKPTASTKANSPKPRSRAFLGPVADLASHLPQEWWRDLFDSLYLRTDGDVVENDANTIREVDILLRATALRPTDRILDFCCGQGRHSLELARRGFENVVGVDRSRYLIRLARRRAMKTSLKVTFHEGDARTFRSKNGNFDAVMLMGNSFGYFDNEEDDIRVLETVKEALRSHGTIALDLTDGDWMRKNLERRSWEWIDGNHFVCRERSLTADGDRLVSREVVVHAERGVIADQFYAERLYSQERILEVLKRVGFQNVRTHATLEAESTQNQDLGMMAKRFFLIASAPQKDPKPIRGKIIRKVTVVMGDHRLPDSVKKAGQFNPEDMDTVQRLKDALSELHGYAFNYINNHATLHVDLEKDQPNFVFNLCDEGFNNDALQELHVPALLEMLDIPYTGAGPACLAMCYDKALVRCIAAALDIPVPLETYMRPEDQSATMPSVFPAILKPNLGDSSIGIVQDSVVYTPEQLVSYLIRLKETLPGRSVLAQEFLTGSEYSVGIIGNSGQELQALPVLEVDYSRLDPNLPRILGYESKWLPDSPYWKDIRYQEAKLKPEKARLIVDASMQLFERLGCRDYARFDFRADAHGTIKLLEVNPNPGWCWDGKLNLMAEFGGIRYADLLRMILEAAVERLTLRETREKAMPVSALAGVA